MGSISICGGKYPFTKLILVDIPVTNKN